MWVTVHGTRRLQGSEAILVCRAVARMSREFMAEIDRWGNDSPSEIDRLIFGIDWFDQWEPQQKLWLLDQVATALLTDGDCLPPAAMFEATVDAIYCEVVEEIEAEIDHTNENDSATESSIPSWRLQVCDAYRAVFPSAVGPDPEDADVSIWRQTVTQLADSILGIAAYQQAEQFRDVSIARLQRFLNQKGLPPDFLERIPPMQDARMGKQAYQRLSRLVSRHDN